MRIPNDDIKSFLQNIDSVTDILTPPRRAQDTGFPECSALEIQTLSAMRRHNNLKAGQKAAVKMGLETVLKMGELAELVGVPLSTATRIVDHLSSKGLVERKQSAEDRRIIQISFTEMGNQINRYIEKERAAQARKILTGLSESQRKQFLRQLDRLA